MGKFPDLKGIAVNATGTNTIDTDYAEKLGVAVRNLGAYSTEDVANHTIALLLALNQKLFIHRRVFSITVCVTLNYSLHRIEKNECSPAHTVYHLRHQRIQ